MTIINEFIDALAIEIDALREGRGGSIVTVYNGELIRQSLDLFIYQFTLENFLIVLDGTPASIDVNGKEYECEIISVTGQQVQISLNHKLTDRIPMARIITNTWYLLERLRKKYEDNLGSQSRFINSNKLFLDENTKIDGGNFNPTYTINGKEPPNPNQHKAIESSINDFLSIIWGPPGTGKTRTIANAIESHLNLGRKILLLSHSNNAVDQALLKVACQVKNTFYKDGLLVRLGTPKQEMIDKFEKEQCSLVLIDNIAKFRSKELIKEKDELNNYLERLQEALQSLRKIKELTTLITEIKRQIDSVRMEIKTQELKRNTTKDEVSQIQQIINDLQVKLIKVKNFGFVKRVFMGVDPTKIEAEIKSTTLNLAAKVNHLQFIEEQLRQLNKTIQPLKDDFNRSQSDLSKNLSRIRKTPAEAQKELDDYENTLTQIKNRIAELIKQLKKLKLKYLVTQNL